MIKRDDYLGDEERAATFEIQRNLNKIGKPVDKSEWGMTPPTVNAYYSPPQNNINFPAGILQPPFYGAKADDAVNLGAIGVVVGHELTHGFDDQGRKYDGAGNLRDWWTPEDARNFETRAECVVDEYDTFSPVDGVKLKGKLTLGENAADNGGIHLAYMALMRDLADKTMPDTKLDGLTPPPAVLSRLRAGLVREFYRCECTRPGHDRPAFTGSVPHQRRGSEYEGVRTGFQLQRGRPDGFRKSLSGLVTMGSEGS